MRNSSRDEVLSDVRARLSLIEGHSGFGGGDDFGATVAQHPAPAKSPAAHSLDALYASVAAVYAETTPQAPKAAPRSAAAIPAPAPRRHDSWSEDHDDAHRALVDPDLPFEDLAPPDWPAPRHAVLEHEMPAAPLKPVAPNMAAATDMASADPAFELLTSRLASLEEKLEAVLERAGTSAPSDDILDRMDELKGQYQRVADEIGRLEVIEDNLARLIDEVAERQPDNGLLADSVAQRIMREISEQGFAAPGQSPAHDERIAGLEHMLSSYVNNRQSQDGNTQHLLQAIHGLVETLDSRVGVIEHEIQQATAADPAGAYEPQYAEAGPAAPAAAVYAEPIPQGQEGEEIDINDFDYDSEMAAAPEDEPEAEPAPARRPALRQYQPAPAPEPRVHSDRESMIASARRAAKAAAGHDGNPLRAKMTEAVPGKIQPKSAVSNRAARFSLDKKSPRPVIIMAALAVVLAGAGLFYLKMSRKPAGPKITIEKTVTPEQGETKKKAGEAPAEDKQSMMLDEPPYAPADLETGSTDGMTFGEPVPMPLSPTRASLETEGTGDGDIAGAVTEDLPPEGIAPLAVRIKAANGDPTAQAQIANQFARGTLGAPDMAKAADWYERAALGGHPPSQYQLAALLERGSGVPQDATLARKWYGKSASAGNVKAMHNLAVLMTTDEGGKRDYAAAAKLFHKAAGFGLADSQFNLAILYENGLGVKRNTSEAYRWFALASEAGDKEALRRRDNIRRRLSPTMIKQIDGEIKAWSPSPVDEPANSVASLQVEAAAEAPEAPAVAAAQPKASDVLLVQDLLKSLGYEVGAPGQLDARTSEAIASFEQRSKLPPTGEISDALIARLASLAG